MAANQHNQIRKIRSMIKTIKIGFGKSFVDLIEIFASNNLEIRFAGETARHILQHKLPKTLDLVSSATLHDMKIILKRQQILATVDNNNAAIVVRLGGLTNKAFVYRIVSICPFGPCGGTVETYWMMHAFHRTFTINSIYIELNGLVHDYFEGFSDIMNNRVRMNLNPDCLIKANHLMIFEYFKLFASVAETDSNHDAITLNAIAANINVLANISGQVIWNEVKSILMRPRRFDNMVAFFQCQGANYLGLPDKPNIIEFKDVTEKSNFPNHPLLGISYLCAFLETQEDVMKVYQRLRLSSYERNLAKFLVQHKKSTKNIDDLAYYKQMCLLPLGANQQISREYVLELLKYHNKKTLFQDLLLKQSSACDDKENKPMELASRPVEPESFQSKNCQLKRTPQNKPTVVNVDVWANDETNDRFSMTTSLLVGVDSVERSKRKSKKKARLQ